MVTIKLFKEEDMNKPYDAVPDSAYMPSFLSGDIDKQNIEKRIVNSFLKTNTDVVKVAWSYQDDLDTIHWMDV